MRGDYVVMARPTSDIPDGRISLSDPQRTWCGIGVLDEFVGETYDPFSQGAAVYIGSMDVEIGFASRSKIDVDTEYDQDFLQDLFLGYFQNQVLAPQERILMSVNNIPLMIKVKTIDLVDPTMTGGGSRRPI